MAYQRILPPRRFQPRQQPAREHRRPQRQPFLMVEIKNKKYAQLVVFSYFFCEQKKDFLMLLFNNRDKFSGGFVVLDYKENIAVIKKYFTDHGDYNIESVNMNYKIPDSLFEFIHEKEVNVYGCYYRP